MKYAIQFTGKRKGSLGIYYPILAEVDANSQALAVLSLYDTYEPFEINDIYEVDKPPMSEPVSCDHLVGYSYQYDNIEILLASEAISPDEKFKYCPECGAKLEKHHVEG